MFGVGCQTKKSSSSSTAPSYLYVSSGVCGSGQGITTFTAATASRVIYRTNVNETDPLRFDGVVVDYNSSTETAANNPGGIVSADDNYFYALVENATSMGARRIDKVPKGLNQTLTKSIYFTDSSANGLGNATAGNILRGIALAADGTIWLGETINLEGVTTGLQRLSAGAAGYALGSAMNVAQCGTTAVAVANINAIAQLPPMGSQTKGKVILANMLNTAAKIVVVNPSTFASGTADCQGGITFVTAVTAVLGPSTTEGGNVGGNTTITAQTTPTALAYVSTGTGTGKLLIGISTSAANTSTNTTNGIVMYDVADSGSYANGSVTFSNPTVLYNNSNVLFGISAMTYDTATNSLYVATSNSQAATVIGYNIEKFTVDLTAKTMTRVTQAGGAPWQYSNAYNKCVNQMMVSN